MLDEKRVKQAMTRVWRMALLPMVAQGVRVAVLTGFRCGSVTHDPKEEDAFQRWYAECLFDVLGDATTHRLRLVVLCFPPTERRMRRAYAAAWQRHSGATGLPMPVRLLTEHDVVSVSQQLAERYGADAVGFLNATSGRRSTRGGLVGRHFADESVVDYEGYAAMSTTLLTMHRFLNPRLWSDAARRIPVPLD